jgi:molecular chaperone DnaJ
MAAVTAAWKVLGDPAARQRYDRSLQAPAAERAPAAPPRPAPASGPTLIAPGPARFPWRFMGVMAAAGIVLVIVGAVTAPEVPARKPDNLLQPNSCVVIERNSDVAEVNCADAHDAVVQQLVPIGSTCPSGTEPHRDRQGMGTACVVLVGAVAGA